MKKPTALVFVLALLGFLVPAFASAACNPFFVVQGGTGNCGLNTGFIPFGGATPTTKFATSTGLFFTTGLSRLSFTHGSSTSQSISGSLWLTALGTPAGSTLAVDPNGLVIATTTAAGGVTAVTGVYPVQSTGGATPAISLAFGTTTANNWSALNIFANATSTLFTSTTSWIGTAFMTNASSTFATLGTVWFPSNTGSILSTSAGGLLQNTTVSSPLSFSGSTLSCPTCSTTTGTVTSITGGTGLSGGTITNTGTLALLSYVATSSAETATRVPFWASTAGTPAQLSGGSAGFTWNSSLNLLTATNASTTHLTAATSLGIPSSASETPTVSGYVANDTTNAQFKVGQGATTAVHDPRRFLTFTYATTTAWTGTTTLALGTAPAAITLSSAQCYTNTGTVNVQYKYGTGPTNVTPMILNASTTIGTVAFTSNNTPAAGNALTVDVGTPATTPTSISCTVTATVTGT